MIYCSQHIYFNIIMANTNHRRGNLVTDPSLMCDESVTPICASTTLVMVAAYVLLGLEVTHSTVLEYYT